MTMRPMLVDLLPLFLLYVSISMCIYIEETDIYLFAGRNSRVSSSIVVVFLYYYSLLHLFYMYMSMTKYNNNIYRVLCLFNLSFL